MVILIDLRNTHNLVDPSMVYKGEIPIEPNEKIRVRVANIEQVFSEGHCSTFKIKIQESVFVTNVYILVLASCDMVLGVQWFKELGPVLWNLKNLSM